MNSLAIIQGQKIVETELDFPVEEKIETMDGLAIIKGQKIVMVGFSRKRNY